jgi:hypothetical protein
VIHAAGDQDGNGGGDAVRDAAAPAQLVQLAQPVDPRIVLSPETNGPIVFIGESFSQTLTTTGGSGSG